MKWLSLAAKFIFIWFFHLISLPPKCHKEQINKFSVEFKKQDANSIGKLRPRFAIILNNLAQYKIHQAQVLLLLIVINNDEQLFYHHDCTTFVLFIACRKKCKQEIRQLSLFECCRARGKFKPVYNALPYKNLLPSFNSIYHTIERCMTLYCVYLRKRI